MHGLFFFAIFTGYIMEEFVYLGGNIMREYFMLLKDNLIRIGKLADVLWAINCEYFHDEVSNRKPVIGTILTAILILMSVAVIVILIVFSTLAYFIVHIYIIVRRLIGKPLTNKDVINFRNRAEDCDNRINDTLNKYYK